MLRVLLAEDTPDIQELIARHLRDAGAEVETAENGRVACEKAMAAVAAGTPFDVILMDIQMPETDGYVATARLRSAGYARPIIALTAHALEPEREKCLRAGCDDFVTKPIDVLSLLSTLQRYVPPRRKPGPSMRRDQEQRIRHSEVETDPEITALRAEFVGRLPERVAAMERSLTGRDLDALATFAHQLQGAAGAYGFPGITKAAEQLAAAARQRGEVEQALRVLANLCRQAGELATGASA